MVGDGWGWSGWVVCMNYAFEMESYVMERRSNELGLIREGDGGLVEDIRSEIDNI